MAFFHHQGEGLDNPELAQMMAPFATLLGTAIDPSERTITEQELYAATAGN